MTASLTVEGAGSSGGGGAGGGSTLGGVAPLWLSASLTHNRFRAGSALSARRAQPGSSRGADGNGHPVRALQVRDLLGLVRENEGVAARILLDFDADSENIRNEVIRMLLGPELRHSAPSEPMAAADDRFPAAMDDVPAAGPDADLGWRGRPMALAALGSAVLARTAFDRSKTGMLEPLEMQLLARLTLGPPDGTLAEPAELFESLTVALACDRDDLRDAVHVLGDRRLIVCTDEQDGDERLSITAAGVSQVHQWLRHVVPLFGRWPPNYAAADDAG